jgi:hypothetical protein
MVGEDGQEDNNTIPGVDKRPRKDKQGNIAPSALYLNTIAGQRTVPGLVINDPANGQPALFFVFTDISSRIMGNHRLLCQIMDMDHIEKGTKIALTKSFEMYSLHTFPGGDEPTILTKSLILQGVSPTGRGYTGLKHRKSSDVLGSW